MMFVKVTGKNLLALCSDDNTVPTSPPSDFPHEQDPSEEEEETTISSKGNTIIDIEIQDIVNHLRMCFPHDFPNARTQTNQEILQEGIGFHDLEDTTWILLYKQNNNDRITWGYGCSLSNNSNTATTATFLLIGLITTIVYHDGLYLTNLSVNRKYRQNGYGLDLLEQCGIYASKCSKSMLIGNANVSDKFIISYYQSLGAQIIQTGIGSDTGGGGSSSSTVRMQRKIHFQTQKDVMLFFNSLRQHRLVTRRRKVVERISNVVVVAAIVGIVCVIGFQKPRVKTLFLR